MPAFPLDPRCAPRLPRALSVAVVSASAITAFLLSGCAKEAPPPAEAPAAAAPAAPKSVVNPNFAFQDAIAAEDFAEHVRVLASDEFEGRAPGTPGEEKTVQYLKAQFERMGLQPGNNGDWFQTVPMMETTADPATTMAVNVGGQTRTLAFGTDMVIGTRTGQPEVVVENSPLVFVGYGVDAPERKWNDYAGLDLRGKTVVMLVNDPGFHAGDEKLFEGRRMTYYGRWTYKFEEAARKGAIAALIVHDTEGASYGWDVVKNSWSGAQYDLRAADDPEPRLPVQGWITGEQAKAIFSAAGQDLDALRAAANKPGFKPVALDAKLSTRLKSTISEKQSRNVLARIPGSERPEETVVYMAHWDHLGKHNDDPGDNIYNGAVDNATGVAGILEVAGRFAKAKPKRSVLFLAVTLEESGLLGSKYFAAKPTLPLHDIVGVINIDAMNVAGRTRDLTVIGKGSSELEDLLLPVAQRQQRTLVEESNPAGGYYFRSDHFMFAKAGVPALYPDGGTDLIDGGQAAGDAAGKDYNSNRYHKPDDEYDPATWKLDGAVEDIVAIYEVGEVLANGAAWPNWYKGNAFKAARDAMMAKKAEAKAAEAAAAAQAAAAAPPATTQAGGTR